MVADGRVEGVEEVALEGGEKREGESREMMKKEWGRVLCDERELRGS